MKLRGNRDYSLVESRFHAHHSLPHDVSRASRTGLRFRIPGFRSYCCALFLIPASPRNPRVIISKRSRRRLGRRSRAQLWDEVLSHPGRISGAKPRSLLRMILSGRGAERRRSSLHRGAMLTGSEASFLRGLQSEDPGRSLDRRRAYLLASIRRSLRSVSTRKKAIQFLGPVERSERRCRIWCPL